MGQFEPNLSVGEIISHAELIRRFKVGTAGGMRRNKNQKFLVIVSDHTKGIYEDRWIDDVLHYTGMGLTGPQSLSYAQNRTLAQSKERGITVFLFEVFIVNEYIYRGPVELVLAPYQEVQPDSKGNSRLVWVFPVRPTAGQVVLIDFAHIESLKRLQQKTVKNYSDAEILIRARAAPQTTGKRSVVRSEHVRNVFVSEHAKRLAKGRCDLCGRLAPFETANREPYLEAHHIVWLAKGGPDTIENTVALCPNCHKKMHIVNNKHDHSKLIARVAERAKNV